MNEMKAVRINDEAHKYLMMQRALTGIPASRQVEILIEKEQGNNEQQQAKETTVLPVLPK
jgi:hypothetical protein